VFGRLKPGSAAPEPANGASKAPCVPAFTAIAGRLVGDKAEMKHLSDCVRGQTIMRRRYAVPRDNDL
jgi:hypothetical protein